MRNMGLPFDFVPFTKREMPETSRVYSYFTKDFRNRLLKIFNPLINERDVESVYSDFTTEYPGTVSYFATHEDGSLKNTMHSYRQFILKAEDELLVDYLEYFLNYCWENFSSSAMLKYDGKLRRALHEERVLFRIRPARDHIEGIQKQGRAYKPSTHSPIHIEYIANEPMVQADGDVRAFETDSKWRPAVDHYNTAWEYYQDGQFNSAIPEELTKAIESMCNTICKEENDWIDDGAGLGRCLDEMKNRGLFEPNNELYPESEKIFTGLKVSAQKPAGDKHGHEEVNQHYVILLLHQTAAFMTYVINRYEELFEESTTER